MGSSNLNSSQAPKPSSGRRVVGPSQPQAGLVCVWGQGEPKGWQPRAQCGSWLVSAQSEEAGLGPETLFSSWLGRGIFHSNSPLVLIDEESSFSWEKLTKAIYKGAREGGIEPCAATQMSPGRVPGGLSSGWQTRVSTRCKCCGHRCFPFWQGPGSMASCTEAIHHPRSRL